MNLTELLVTGFDGDKVVFATSLTPGTAATVLTGTDDGGQTRVVATSEQATPAFAALMRVLADLGGVGQTGDAG